MRKLLNVLVIFLLILNFISCDKTSRKSTSDNQKIETTGNQASDGKSDIKLANAPVPKEFEKVMVGKIDNYPITMLLTRKGDVLEGSYSYDKPHLFLNIDIEGLLLKGNVSSDNTFTVQETETTLKDGESKEKITGNFVGKIIAEQRANNVSIKISGDWTNSEGNKKLNFFLTEELFSLAEGINVVTKEVKEENKEKRYEINVSYPQFEPSESAKVKQLNQHILEFVKDAYEDFKENVGDGEEDLGNPEGGSDYQLTYQLKLVNEDLVSIEFLASDYYQGAAHPNNGVMTFNYDVKRADEIELEDLFLPGSNYVSLVNNICNKAAKGKEYSVFFNDEKPEENLNKWNISKKGIYFQFEVAHAIGDVATIFIPFSELKDVINAEGKIKSLFK